MTKKEKNLAMTKGGIATGTTSPRNDKAGKLSLRGEAEAILHYPLLSLRVCRRQTKQSYINVTPMWDRHGLTASRWQKKKTASRWRVETVIANEVKQSYIDVTAQRSEAILN